MMETDRCVCCFIHFVDNYILSPELIKSKLSVLLMNTSTYDAYW